METVIILVLLAAIVVIWAMSAQRKLVVMEENINNAMRQIGVQMSSRLDVLSALADLTKDYDAHESQTLVETINARRSAITARSTPQDVLKQEDMISAALGRIAAAAEQYPDLKADQSYGKYIGAVNSYGNMVRTSRLIYNDSVTRLNRAVCIFPTALIAPLLGFRRRDYLETAEDTAAAVPDVAAEIQKFKILFDAGAITEEEFTAKKKQLLGI